MESALAQLGVQFNRPHQTEPARKQAHKTVPYRLELTKQAQEQVE